VSIVEIVLDGFGALLELRVQLTASHLIARAK
jgi:hypothetical protein